MTVADRYANLSPLKRALLAIDELQARLEAAENAHAEPIAIIGLGCRFPGAPNPEAFWALLEAGKSAVSEVPAERWKIDEYYDPDPDAPGKMCARRAGFLEQIDRFDRRFFEIAPREAVSMDPQQRLFLEVCWEALEHAGIAADRLSGSATGVFVGIAAGDYADLLKAHGARYLDGHFASGVAHSVVPGRLSYILGLQGPSLAIDTACSSSLVAVHLACQSLRVGDCSLAIAGGVNLIVTPDNSVLFSKARMLAPDGDCKTFDAAADGFVRGEGAGVVVLKKLSRALADGDRICAVIRGSAVNQDGPSSGLTAPNGPAQEAVMRAALARAQLTPADVDFVEAHGTGTPLGDPIEVQALGAVHRGRPRDRPLAIGSIKTNVGHLEAAAGVAGLIKLVLSLQHEALPAHLHLKQLSPHVDWAALPLRVVTELLPWPRGERRRIGGLSSFGFSGTNAHLLVEEAPAIAKEPALERPAELVVLSGRSQPALRAAARALAAFTRTDQAPLADIAHTLNTGRAQLTERAAFIATDRAALTALLETVAADAATPFVHRGRVASGEPLRIGMLFTGQGAQYPGMARELFEMQPGFRHELEQCDALLRPWLDRSLLSLLYPAVGETSLLDQTAYTQPALFAIDYALGKLWLSLGVQPHALIGHSLGEFVAACLAGVFSLEDGLRLVAARGRLMQQLPDNGAMASVFCPEPRVARAVAAHASRLAVAAVNDPTHTVISGDREALQAVLTELEAEGFRAKPLAVSHAFHSPLMAPMLAEFESVARSVSYHSPRISVISNVTGRVATGGELTNPEYWLRHVLAPVRFAEGIATLAALGVTAFLEAGPQPTLLGMAARNLSDPALLFLPSLRSGQSDWTRVLESSARLFVAGARLNSRALDPVPAPQPIALPTYPFERERLWPDAVPPLARPIAARAAHPLLSQRLRVAGGGALVLEGALGRETPWLLEHRVHGSLILPGAAFVEIASAAASAHFGLGAHLIRGLSLLQTLVVDESRGTLVQAVVNAEADGTASFRLFSAPSSGTDPEPNWQLHAEARLERADSEPLEIESRAEIEARCSEPVDSNAFYQQLRVAGLELGPAFQGLSAAQRGVGEAYALLHLPADLASARYRVHPILLDLAIQTLGVALLSPSSNSASYLPFAIDRARIFADAGVASWAHARCRSAESSDEVKVADITLRDDSGRVVAQLEGLRLKRASAGARRRSPLVQGALYSVEWQPAPSLTSGWLPPLSQVEAAANLRIPEAVRVHGLRAFDEALPQLEALSGAFVVEALLALEVPLRPGNLLLESELAERCGVVPAQRQLFTRLLEILQEDGLLRREDRHWLVTRAPEREDTLDWLTTLETHYGVPLQAELALLRRCGPQLAGVLRGRVDPLALLFPDGSSQLAENLYRVSPAARAFNGLLADTLASALEQAPPGRRTRLLEIGGGTASTTAFVIPVLDPERTEYVFSDVSPAFTARASQKFGSLPFFRVQPLDIERDPATQGFAEQHFDVIIAANVLHATRDLAETFRHVHSLLAPGGLLVLLEMLIPQRWIDLTFGLTDGWWRFVDRDLRPSYPLLDRQAWRTFLGGAGFDDLATVPSGEQRGVLAVESVLLARRAELRAESNGPAAFRIIGEGAVAAGLAAQLVSAGHACSISPSLADWLASDQPSRARGVIYLDALDEAVQNPESVAALRQVEERLCGGLLRVVQRLTEDGSSVPLTIVTRRAQALGGVAPEPAQAPLWGVARVVALEHPELLARCIDIDDSAASLAGLSAEILHGSAETQVAYRDGQRCVARLVDYAGSPPHGGERPARYRVQVTSRGAIDRLEFGASERRAPGPHEVELRVEATALNFRDVLNVLGMYPGDPGPLGNECVGTVTALGSQVSHLALGDEVVGLLSGSLANYAIGSADFLLRRPASLPPEQAVSLPIAYLTAAFALQRIGRLAAGERVLIHAAAGGVGLAAVHLALRAGAQVFATAGSADKRTYLRSLGVEHVFSSRELSFAAEIAKLTEGRGVDIVLNSLAGDFIAASVDALGNGGRFLEIGKSGWAPERMAATGKQLEYHVIDWSVEARQTPELIVDLLAQVIADVASGSLPALPRRVFDIGQVSDAFRFMAQAKHTGKVLVSHVPRSLMDAAGSYLVTGGLTGLGLLCARWMVERGARSVVLMGRREPSVEARAAIEAMRSLGARITISQGDVAREADVSAALNDAGPNLRGVLHAAGVLDDGGLLQQSWSRFETVFAPKVFGAHHLDRLTRERSLDFFVLFSSLAAVLGSRGQANHAAANSYLDLLAHRRRAEGRPGLSINWGVWAETGAAVRLGVAGNTGERGVGVIEPALGLEALERLLLEDATQVTVSPMDWPRFTSNWPTDSPPRFFQQVAPRARANAVSDARAKPLSTKGAPTLVDALSAAPAHLHARLISTHLREQAARILALPAGEVIDPRQPLNELGLDSLMAVELRNVLAAASGLPLSATLLFDYPTLQALTAYFVAQLTDDSIPRSPSPAARGASEADRVLNVMDRIDDLSDAEVDRLLAQRSAGK